VAALAYPDKNSPSGYTFRIALGSVAPTPIRVREAESILMEEKVNEERITEAALAAQSTAKPIDDVRASARYRSEMVRTLTQRALMDVWAQVQ
jgi:carbon-monoxide dehydrogenase medium subunit